MKSLTKIRIINWHYFWDETIEIKPIVFLTGPNASGKSTLIDALQVVLLGDTTGRNFNKAASEKSARTLKGYLKCEVGDLDDGRFRYLREGRFTSYIALEFSDDSINKYFTMGIVFDSFGDGSETHKFFYLADSIPQNNFVINKIPMDYKTLNQFLYENYKSNYRFFDSNKDYQIFLKKQFGGLKDKYFSLLKRSTSFSPITDITHFITDYVCDPQQDIELGSLQDNILQYKKLEVESNKIGKRIEKLKEISTIYNRYKENNEKFKVAEYILEKCNLEKEESKLRTYENNLNKYRQRIIEIEEQIVDLDSEITSKERNRINLIKDKTNNDTLRILDELNEQKIKVEKEIKDINYSVINIKENLSNYLNKYLKSASLIKDNISSLNNNLIDEDRASEIALLKDEAKDIIDSVNDFKKIYLDNLKELSSEEFEFFINKILHFKDAISSLRVSFSRTLQNIEKKIQNLRAEEINIKSGKKTYDKRLTLIKTRLEEELMRKFNTKIEVNIFADLIDIKDVSWKDAIEGFLFTQKLNLFVAPKYYIDAYNILRKLVVEYNFYSLSLIDQERIIEKNYQADYESLAEEIITDHKGARAYANFLIGRLHKSDNVDEARDSGNGITKNCDIYRNFSLSRINPSHYQSSVIGRSVNERFIEEKARELNSYLLNLNIFKKFNNLLNEANDFEVISKYEMNNILENIEDMAKLNGLTISLKEIEIQLKENDTEILSSIEKRIKKIEDQTNELRKDRDLLIQEKTRYEEGVKDIKDFKIIEIKKIIKELKEKLINNYDQFFVEEKALPIFENYQNEGLNLTEIFTKVTVEVSSLQYTSNSIFQALTRLRREYTQEFKLSYELDCKDNEIYDNELSEFENVLLPQYKAQIEDVYNKAIHEFKDEFMNKLREAIFNVEDQIENLNKALSQFTFGRDSYKFTVKPSKENERYYKMLKDESIFENQKDDSLFIEKYQYDMEELFKNIVDTGDGNKNNELLNNVSRYTDYRSYLDFDLIVYNNDTGEEQRLSKMIKKKSGGETQTPFYIAVLASFAQLYHVNDEGELANTIRLIIFDEAFSKMDQRRIKESIKLLKEFNLQVLVSAPSDKIKDISALVDETLVVYHDKNSSHVGLYRER